MTQKRKNPHYIIVGAGTAGSVLARFLSDNYKKRVLVLERGLDKRSDPITNGGLITLPTNGSDLTYDKKYTTSCFVPDEFNGLQLGELAYGERYVAGTGSGGSSSVNYMLSVRGINQVYDQWGDISGRPDLWNGSSLLPIQKGLEKFIGLSQNPEERGTNGKLSITQVALAPEPIMNVLAPILGVPILDDYNVSTGNLCVSYPQYNVSLPNFARSYGFNEYLSYDILDDKGKGLNGRQLKVKFQSTVTKIIIEDGEAVGVQYLNKHGHLKKVYAKKKVILCAGAPFSASILQHSGIGDPSILEPLDIDVVVNNPNVGKNLVNHFGVSYAMRGILTNPLDSIVGFAQLNDPVNQRKIQVLLQQNAGLTGNRKSLLGIGPVDPNDPNTYVNLYIGGYIWNLKPAANGTAFIINKNPTVYPDIKYNYYQDGDQTNPNSDLSTAIASYKIAKQLADAISTQILWPPADAFTGTDSDAKLARCARSDTDTAITFHCSGTCNMSQSINNGVVDGELHVFGVKNLMVADLSIAPIIPSGNTGTPAYYIGTVAAKILGANVPLN